MWGKSIALLAAVLALTGTATARAEETRTIVLFGASWCAPCRVELRQLPAFSAAAAPDRIEVAWIDRAPSAAVANATVVPPAEASRRFAQLTGSNQGLPVTAIFDAKGRVCGIHRAPATTRAIAQLRESCSSR